jgi:Cof subfamily protein (haloacid dehalogenase superfamily)
MRRKDILKNIEVVVSDIDGTLLTDDGLLDKETMKLISKLPEYGVHFTVATGRLHSAIMGLAEDVGIDIPLISMDGALIKSHTDGTILFESFVKEKYVRKAIDLADSFLLNIALCHDDAIYFTERNSVIPQIMDKFGARYEEVLSYDDFCGSTLEVVFASDYRDNLKYVHSRLGFPYTFGLNSSFFKSQRHENIFYLEIRNKGTSKGMGFERLLKHLKVKPANAAVIGDWYNDLSLFQAGGFKVAVANAVPEIKKYADFITARDNNSGGVAEFIEMILQAKTSTK